MAQNHDPFHVPQHNRRNKLRLHQNPPPQPFSHHHNHQDLSLCLSFQQPNNNLLGDVLKRKSSCEMRSLVPLGPFTGYASILKRSRFLKPTQQILEDLCGADGEVIDCSSLGYLREREWISCRDSIENRWRNSSLVMLLDEVYKRYKLYCQQMESVISSFDTVPGLGKAAPYLSFAVKPIAKQFKCLKDAVFNQIHFTAKISTLDDCAASNNWTTTQHGSENLNPTLNQLTCFQHPVWRSQRGLPDHAVSMLKNWLYEHFLHPYPTDSEKQLLAQHTGLSRTQVSNWFINARVRLWKPMVEEMHILESQQPQIPSEFVNKIADTPLDPPSSANQFMPKRLRTEFPYVSAQIEVPPNMYSSNVSGNLPMAIEGNRGVSLALGLRWNNAIDFEPGFGLHFGKN